MPVKRQAPDKAAREAYGRWTFTQAQRPGPHAFEERQVEAARWRVVFAATDHATSHGRLIGCAICAAVAAYDGANHALELVKRKEKA